MKKIFTLLFSAVFFCINSTSAQNIFNGEPVQVVGSFNGYSTTPYSTDYRTTSFRRVSVNTGTPTDGRGQWATTINIQATGGDATPANMVGGGGNGFLFISGPSANRFQNKWVFNGVGQGAMDAINDCVYNAGEDMGLNMNNVGYYTFVMNDCGYTATNARYFVAYTAAAPVNITAVSQTVNVGLTTTVNITTSAAPSAGEKIYVRYIVGGSNDFSGANPTNVIEATGAGTSYTATIPILPGGAIVNYYVFTSTRTLTQINAATETERSLAVIRYNDNAGANYTFPVILPVSLKSFTGKLRSGSIGLEWQTASEGSLMGFEVEKQVGNNWINLSFVQATNSYNGSSYSYNDVNLLGINTYRIKTISNNGEIKYSQIIVINNGKIVSTQVYPTIIQGNSINIRTVETETAKANVRIIDLNGKQLKQSGLEVAAGDITQQYQLPALKTGVYFIEVSTKNGKKLTKILVQ